MTIWDDQTHWVDKNKTSITIEELTKAWAICEKATAAPWVLSPTRDCIETGQLGKDGEIYGGYEWAPVGDPSDDPDAIHDEAMKNGAFIEMARGFLPRLIKGYTELANQLKANAKTIEALDTMVNKLSSIIEAAGSMRDGHEGCVVQPACGNCFRCEFDQAVDQLRNYNEGVAVIAGPQIKDHE